MQNKTIKTIIKQLRSTIRSWINNRLQNTHNHYLCYLPTKIGFLATWFHNRFFSGIIMGKDQLIAIKDLPPNAVIIYVTKYKSSFDYLFYYSRYKQQKLKVPEIGLGYRFFVWQPINHLFQILLAKIDSIYQNHSLSDPYKSDYIKQELINGRSAFLSLNKKKGFYRRFIKARQDPISYLIQIQQSIEQPIFLVPQLMFFGTKPASNIPSLVDIVLGSKQKPGRIRKLIILFKNPGKVFVEISEPFNLKKYIKNQKINDQHSLEHQTLVLRRALGQQFNRHRQSITGPILKSIDELKESILTNDQLGQFMSHHAKTRNEPLFKVRKEADGYLDEIAARYNIGILKFLALFVGWISNTMFDGADVDPDELKMVKANSQKGPLILVPCHKSHIDYLILSYVLFNNNMPCPHIAAGKNLSFWPLGPIFRSGGAFFIRRTFRGAALYSKVFSAYIYKLLEEGFNIEQFIEGGRSRTGKLLVPKLGLLSILLNAYKSGACEDMLFVPVFIGYDRILEENAYLQELEGGKKEPESLLQVIKARKFLKKRFGKIYIKFHEPVSINNLLLNYNSPLKDMTIKEQNILCRDLGWRIINAIDRLTVVTPHSLVASAILNISQKHFTQGQILDIINSFVKYLIGQKAKLADTILMDQQKAVTQAFEAYFQRKFLELILPGKKTQPNEQLYRIKTGKRLLLEYYKNNSISYFIPAAFTSLAILEKDAFQFSATNLNDRYCFLKDFFKYEFAFNMDRSEDFYIRKAIKFFIDDAMLMPHQALPDTYNITASGLRKIKLYARFLLPYFESYKIVLGVYKLYPRKDLTSKNRLKKFQSRGNRMFKKEEIELPESLSKINYNNAVSFFTNHKIRGSENMEQILFFENEIQQFLILLNN